MTPTKTTFHETGEFQALLAAQDWCISNGFSYGGGFRNDPIALIKGNVLIARWKNLTVVERLQIDGKMTSYDFREGPVKVEIF